MASQVAQRESPCPCRRRRRRKFYPWVGKIPWSRKWQPSLEFLPGKVPWTEEPIGLQSVGSQSVGHDWAHRHTRLHKHLGKFEEKHVTPKLSAWSLSLKDMILTQSRYFKLRFSSDLISRVPWITLRWGGKAPSILTVHQPQFYKIA